MKDVNSVVLIMLLYLCVLVDPPVQEVFLHKKEFPSGKSCRHLLTNFDLLLTAGPVQGLSQYYRTYN